MAGNRKKFSDSKKSDPGFWADGLANGAFSPPASPAAEATDDMDIDKLASDFTKVSIQETSRAVLTDTNTNFNDLCNQLNSLQVSNYRKVTLKEADLIAERVEDDLNLITKLHGASKSSADEEKRFMIAQVVQAYKRCLELDIEKWKYMIKAAGKSDSEIAAVKIIIREFIPWERRQHSAPTYAEEKLQKPVGNTISNQISFVQLALNYWRSCYRCIREYEKLINAKPFDVEKQLWELEQRSLSYLRATGDERPVDDINQIRLREPRNIDPTTGQPLSVAGIQEMIQQQQDKAGYKSGPYPS